MAVKKRSVLQKMGIVPVTPKQLQAEGQAQYQSDVSASMERQKANTQNTATSQPTQTGSYDAAKGGYVTDKGQLYPTNNPKFVPGATGQPGTSIEFTKDNMVIVDGKTLTREQYAQQQRDQPYTDAVAKEQQRQEQQQNVSQLGLSQQEIQQAQMQATEAPIDKGQAFTAGLANIAPSLAGGAAGGAAIGAIGGAGVGAIPGAVIGGVGGAITGFLNGIRANIKSQQSGEIASTKKTLTAAKTNMRQLATLASKDPANAAQYVELYNQQLANVYRAQAKLKLETQGNLNAFMEDGTQDLAEFELFLEDGGLATIYEQRLAMALMSGAPMEFTTEDLEGLE